jgi:25S rRNA (cytosine2278-C5)-methyltransferase
VRVNSLKTSTEDYIRRLNSFHFTPVSQLNDLDSTKMGYFVDDNVPDLFAFSPHHPIRSTFEEEYDSGAIILQDKASCIPVVLLDPPRGARVLDACAAPGNKTTQLAATVGSAGRVVAVERDQKRVETLRHMVEKAGAAKCTLLC